MSDFGRGALAIAGKQDKIFSVFEKCGLDYDKIDPYTQMRLSRLMYSIFPFTKKAINDIAGMVGNIQIVGDIPEDKLTDLNQLALTLPILSEYDWEKPHEKGFNNLVKRIARTALRDGMAFIETREDNGQYIGELIYNSENFSFDRYDNNPYKLTYQQNQYPDLETGMFKYIGYDFTNEHPFASPLLSGGGFFTHILISILVAIKNTNMRKGAPVELGILAVKESDDLKGDKVAQDKFKAAVNDINTELQEAAKYQLDGTPYTIVGKMPVDVNLLTYAFGVESVKEIDNNILWTILVQLMNLLEVPAEFFGMVLGSSGFSGDRFKIMYKIWGSKIDDLREKISPIIKQIITDFFLSQGVDARVVQKVQFEFKTPKITDEKEIAETGKINAEADKIKLETANMLAANDTRSARNYLLQHGLIE